VRSGVAVVTCVIALLFVNVSIAQKERLLASGRVAYLELAPVDPRSLMQGDYMALRFRVANDAQPFLARASNNQMMRMDGDLATVDGHLVVSLDGQSIAGFARLDDGGPLGSNEIRLRYRVREGRLRFATNAFFFQEGSADLYERARYGEFRVAADGDLLLKSLRGPNLETLGPPAP
jgi:uncharacterized membrane-anchored protein